MQGTGLYIYSISKGIYVRVSLCIYNVHVHVSLCCSAGAVGSAIQHFRSYLPQETTKGTYVCTPRVWSAGRGEGRVCEGTYVCTPKVVMCREGRREGV